ncbi:hypothetical protein P5E99_07785 [Clostridium perfringens]|uniref:hypothetical protein n=1 Tax=Clostridium perfringens TaxID=1502 RepID=UPI0018E465FB|nr:hypothetical protein [Clostridium perfringens]MBI6014473.1 hypothetical protein [Clostridium perfringens]MBO3421724.1 hypothetical protein [Clostridium perfringens]MDK0673834.1 hypothetical protein [Clostridium perfringens]MDK0673884.1 hypothetical protein [Clostridium perfringens]MDM1006138.1 hypothetical protein [Clostridium perfringens]
MKKTSDKINNKEKERMEEIYGKIHKNFLKDKTERNEIDYLYKKLYLHYINLIENNKLDIKQEIAFIELKMNRHENEMFRYYIGLFIGIISGTFVALITVLIDSDFSKEHLILSTLGIALIFLIIYIIIKFSKKDIKGISNEKLYYSTCLLVLNDLEEELL